MRKPTKSAKVKGRKKKGTKKKKVKDGELSLESKKSEVIFIKRSFVKSNLKMFIKIILVITIVVPLEDYNSEENTKAYCKKNRFVKIFSVVIFKFLTKKYFYRNYRLSSYLTLTSLLRKH